MEGAAGSANDEMAIVEESIEFKLNALKQTWVGLLQELIDRGDLGELIDNLITISEALAEIIKQIGLMPSLGVIGTAIFGITKPREFIDTLNSIVNVISKAKALKNVGEIADGVYKVTNAVESIGEVSKGINEATVTVKAAGNIAEEVYGVSNAVEVAGEAASEGSVGFSGLAGSLASIPPVAWGVVIALTAIAGVAYKTYQANENLKKSAKQLSRTYNTSVKDIDSYQSQVSKLQEKLNDSNISHEDAKNARIELLSIQDELIQKYGTEAKSIDAIGQAINGNISAFEKLKKLQWQQIVTEFNTQDLKGFDTMNRFVHGVKTNSELAVKEMENGYIHFEVSSVDVAEAKRIAEIYGDTFNPEAKEYFINTENLEESYQKLLKIREEVSKTGKSWTDLDKAINSAKDKIDDYSGFYNQLVLQERIFGTEFESYYTDMQKAYQDYYDAVTEGDEESAKKAKEKAVEIASGLEDALADSNLGDSITSSIRNSIENLYPELKAEIEKWDFSNDIPVLKKETLTEDDSVKIANEIKNFDNETELLSFDNEKVYKAAEESRQKAYDEIEKLANEYNMDAEELIAAFREKNPKYLFARGDNTQIINSVKESLAQKSGDLVIIPEIDQTKIESALNSISAETYETVSLFNKSLWDEVGKYAKEKFGTSYLPNLSTDQMVEAITNVANAWEIVDGELQKVQEDIPDFNFESFSKNIEDLNSLSSAYDKFIEKVNNNDKDLSIDIGDIESLREKFGEFENFNVFEKIVTDANSTKEEVQKAFDDMATACVNAKVDLSGATFGDLGAIETQLEKTGLLTQGVQNYVRERIIANEAEQTANQIKASGNAVTDQTIQELITEGREAGLTADELQQYAAAFMAASGLSLTGDASWLQTLIKELQLAEGELGRFANMMKSYSIGTNVSSIKNKTSLPSDVLSKRNNMYARHENQQKLGAKTSDTGTGGGGGGGGGGAADEAEKTKDIMAELSSQLDEIQSKWESLTDILDHYNETGKVTIDQAQELFQTDWKYLALLGDGTGIVQNADEAFQSLAEAKINEMRVQLARNAIDAINGLNDEAEAAKYLSNAYLDLADGALAAEEAILQTALATKLAKGGSIAAAAEMIYKGYQNAKMLTANIDYSKKDKDKDSDKDKDKDKDDKDKDSKEKKQEETYEKEFNWIETLLERLNKTTEKWTKRAEKFFNYMNKNWALNKARSANQEEINAQKQAYKYYKEQADKVRLSQKYKDQVDNGLILYETIHSPLLGKKIEEYQKWKQLVNQTRESLEELYDAEREMITQQLNNIIEYFDTIDNYYNSILSKIDARISKNNAWGNRTTIADIGEQLEQIFNLQDNKSSELFTTQTGVSKDLSNHRTAEEINEDINSLYADATSTAKYKELVNQIAKLQSKSKLSKKQQEELDKLQAEKEAIDNGILADEVGSYRKIYEEWYKLTSKLNTKGKLSAKEQIKLEQLIKEKENLESHFTDNFENYNKELKDLAVAKGEEIPNVEQNLEETKSRLEKLYKDQIDEVQDSYKNTVQYQNLYKQYLTEKNKKNPNSKKLEQYEEQLQLLADAGTDENVGELLTAIKYIQKNRGKNLKGKNAEKYDQYTALINNAKTKKLEELDALTKERADAIEQLQLENGSQLNEIESDLYEYDEKVAEAIKSLIDTQISELQGVIDNLQETIDNSSNVLSALTESGIETIQKYDLGKYLGIADDSNFADAFVSQTQTAIEASMEKLNASKAIYTLYDQLIKAGENGDWSGIIANWRGLISDNILNNITKAINDNIIAGNDFTDEFKKAQNETRTELVSTAQSITKFKEELRENVYFKAINNALEQIDALNNKLSSAASLIKDEWVTDSNGITEYGLTKVNLLAKELNNAQAAAGQYANKIAYIESLSEDDLGGYDSREEKVKALAEAYSDYYDALSNVQGIEDSIYEIGRKIAEEELETVRKLVDAYRQALQSRKSYYEYDKQIKDRSKSIQAIESEIAALERVNTAASKARVKTLQEQLQSSQDELEELKKEHEYDMQEQALDKLITTLEDNLNNVANTIEESFEYYAKVVQETIAQAVGVDVNGNLSNIYDLLMNIKNPVVEKDKADAKQKKENELQSLKDKRDSLVSRNQILKNEDIQESYDIIRDLEDEYKDVEKKKWDALSKYKNTDETLKYLVDFYNYDAVLTSIQDRIDNIYDNIDRYETKIFENNEEISKLDEEIIKKQKEATDTSIDGNYIIADGIKYSGDITMDTLSDMGYDINVGTQMLLNSSNDIKKTLSENEGKLASIETKISDSITAINNQAPLLNNIASVSEKYSKEIASSIKEIQKNVDYPLSKIGNHLKMIDDDIISLKSTTFKTTTSYSSSSSTYSKATQAGLSRTYK